MYSSTSTSILSESESVSDAEVDGEEGLWERTEWAGEDTLADAEERDTAENEPTV